MQIKSKFKKWEIKANYKVNKVLVQKLIKSIKFNLNLFIFKKIRY